MKAWWNLSPIGGTFSGTFWQPKTGLPQNQVENTFAPKPLNMAEDPKSYRRRKKLASNIDYTTRKCARKLDAGYPESPRQWYFDVFIPQSMDAFYTRKLLHQAPFTIFALDTFCTRHLPHQTRVTPDILQQTTFTSGILYTRNFLHQTFYNKQLLHQAPFTTFTLDTLYTRHLLQLLLQQQQQQQLLHQSPFTPGTFCAKQLLH